MNIPAARAREYSESRQVRFPCRGVTHRVITPNRDTLLVSCTSCHTGENPSCSRIFPNPGSLSRDRNHLSTLRLDHLSMLKLGSFLSPSNEPPWLIPSWPGSTAATRVLLQPFQEDAAERVSGAVKYFGGDGLLERLASARRSPSESRTRPTQMARLIVTRIACSSKKIFFGN